MTLHTPCDETFYVLEGAMEFHLDERTITLEAGSLVAVPRGMSRTFRNPGPDAAQMLVIAAPPDEGAREPLLHPLAARDAGDDGGRPE